MLLNDTHKGYVTSKEKKPRLNLKPTRPRPNESESGEMLAKLIVSPKSRFWFAHPCFGPLICYTFHQKAHKNAILSLASSKLASKNFSMAEMEMRAVIDPKDKYQVEADKLKVQYEKDKAEYEAGK